MKKIVFAPIMFLSLITLSSCDLFAKQVSVDTWLNSATSCKDTAYKSAEVKTVTILNGNKQTRTDKWTYSNGEWDGPASLQTIMVPGIRAVDLASFFLDLSYDTENYSVKFYSNLKVELKEKGSSIFAEYKFNSYGYMTGYKSEDLATSYGIFATHDGTTVTISYNPLW